jgi:hypothetical protein
MQPAPTATSLPHALLPLTLLALCGLALPGCVERTARITTHPSGALVTVNDEEVGISPVKFNFVWHGDYDIIVRKPGYQTLKTHFLIKAPWYELPPIDLIAETMIPTVIQDHHDLPTFVLEPAEPPTTQAVLERAEELRERALFEGETKPAGK